MILTGPTRAPLGPLCLPDQWPLSWAHPSVTRSSSCSQPLEQPRPSLLQIGSQQPLGDPFSAIVSGQMALPLLTAPQAWPWLPAATGRSGEAFALCWGAGGGGAPSSALTQSFSQAGVRVCTNHHSRPLCTLSSVPCFCFFHSPRAKSPHSLWPE